MTSYPDAMREPHVRELDEHSVIGGGIDEAGQVLPACAGELDVDEHRSVADPLRPLDALEAGWLVLWRVRVNRRGPLVLRHSGSVSQPSDICSALQRAQTLVSSASNPAGTQTCSQVSLVTCRGTAAS